MPSSRCLLLCGLALGGHATTFAQTSTPQTVAARVPTLSSPASDPVLTKPAAELTPQQVAGMQKTLADWAQLGHYQAENAKLGPPAAGEQRVVFYGDSITDFWGRGRGRFFPGKPWVNRGISGQTTPQMLVRFEQDVLALRPEVVVILAGINDIAGNTGRETLPQIEDNFRTMVALSKAAHVRVVLSSVLPASHFAWRPAADPTAEVVALNTWLRSFASEEHATYLDYYPSLAGPDGGMRPEYTPDGIHPNTAGYAVMEPLAAAAVTKALSQPRP